MEVAQAPKKITSFGSHDPLLAKVRRAAKSSSSSCADSAILLLSLTNSSKLHAVFLYSSVFVADLISVALLLPEGGRTENQNILKSNRY